ncbi:MAG: ABC transporter permease [Clostridia bacterium]|nr:ABC transporter permease [Clostridia bacterium]
MDDIKNKLTDSQFEFVSNVDISHDKKFETKPVGYFRDAFRRFCKNKSSVAAAVIILILVLYAIIVPLFMENDYTKSLTDTEYLQYTKLLPKSKLFSWAGWDGCEEKTINENVYNMYRAIGVETGYDPIKKVVDSWRENGSLYYKIKIDSYYALGMLYKSLTYDEYEKIQAWQNEHDIQVIFPAVNTSSFTIQSNKENANIWYEIKNNGAPKLDADGNIVPLYLQTGNDGGYHSKRVADDDGTFRYAKIGGTIDAMSYNVRVSKYNYFIYKYGREPYFVFGTNAKGQDIFTRLAAAAQFSFMLALFVSLINLTIGAIYGAIEGYFGGLPDLIMERVTDILSGIPFVVVTTLFQLHLANKVGPIVSLLFAFVTTGWIGMAGTVRMQFYRYKNQEYVLAARTLGAKNARIMFKHIFPNSLGTIVTSCVLVIPGVIFSESSLTYLGIVNLESSTMTSVGTMLANGREFLSTYPHIILFPALFIALLEISFNLFGNGLRDAFNPSLRGTED